MADGDSFPIDNGTLARTGSPTPGPIGLDAKRGGTPAPTQQSIGERVVAFSRLNRGKRVGDGECFALADKALRGAGARSAADYGTVTPDADYVWGRSVHLSELKPGDIIQLRDYSYERTIEVENPDGSGSTRTETQERPHHTAIVERVDGGAVIVLEQNAPEGSPVVRTTLYFSGSTGTSGNTTTRIAVHGTWWFYRPEAR